MMRPDFIGSKCLYLNPTDVSFSSAEIALIDTPVGTLLSPYAYTATVREDYDTVNYKFGLVPSAIAASQRVGFGLFLTPDLEKGNLLFQVTGKLTLLVNQSANFITGSFFFGRKATNNTVVSSKAAVANQLDQWMMVPSDAHETVFQELVANPPNIRIMRDSCETQVYTLALAAGFVYCFGYFFDNNSASSASILGNISLSVRKYQSELSVFRPSR